MSNRAGRHGPRDGFAYRAMHIDEVLGDAKHVVFGLVRIRDEAAIHDSRRSGNVRQQRCDETARAGLGRGDHHA